MKVLFSAIQPLNGFDIPEVSGSYPCSVTNPKESKTGETYVSIVNSNEKDFKSFNIMSSKLGNFKGICSPAVNDNGEKIQGQWNLKEKITLTIDKGKIKDAKAIEE